MVSKDMQMNGATPQKAGQAQGTMPVAQTMIT